jgi:alkylated DNA repair dioxygenase AlkB
LTWPPVPRLPARIELGSESTYFHGYDIPRNLEAPIEVMRAPFIPARGQWRCSPLHTMKHDQLSLFAPVSQLPAGFDYRPDWLSAEEERALVESAASLPFKEFEFRGFLGKRRVVSYGWRYDYNGGGLQKSTDLPPFLLRVRQKAADFAGLSADELRQALVTEYRPGAPIGWHKDRPVFGEVVGISLLSACNFRFRRRTGTGWERAALMVEPRSVYLLQGLSRTDWEHSIPAGSALRYSITFRKFRSP